MKLDTFKQILTEAIEKHKQWNHAEFIACLEQNDAKHYLITERGRAEIRELVQHELGWSEGLVDFHIAFEMGVVA